MRLERLTAGMAIPWGGDQISLVDEALARAFQSGDRLIVDQESGDLLRVPAAAAESARAAVDRAAIAFTRLASTDDKDISRFFAAFAGRLADNAVWAEIAAANAADVAKARAAGRTTTRLEAHAKMRAEMIAGLDGWRDARPSRGRVVGQTKHQGWSMDLETAPLGVVGFVFEGRPNVLVDAAGVLRGGNTAVLRIGADALGTARAIAELALQPALQVSGLPEGAVSLIDHVDRAAGWALFCDPRVALAVARGSGQATRQLGGIARQSGLPVSLHGTGGAWLAADVATDADRFASVIARSLDRKVCNTLNVCCLVRSRAAELAPVFAEVLWQVGETLGHGARVHVSETDLSLIPANWRGREVRVRRADGDSVEPFVTAHAAPDLGHEWEWEATPEVWLTVVEDLDEAIARFNADSPRFIASLISDDAASQQRFYEGVEAAFVGDGFTRWVDGQYALGRPELGLSNWQAGRLFARSGFLVGDGVFCVRARMRQSDAKLQR
ncbi:MAG TPA: aldehyde dehydrogenase family protein [Caulobacteraceae bacterium]